ncbi:MAG: hypothetical protein RL012_480 [Bacteroidota bacterium]|jgi:hypothetical protein
MVRHQATSALSSVGWEQLRPRPLTNNSELNTTSVSILVWVLASKYTQQRLVMLKQKNLMLMKTKIHLS